MNSHHKRDVVTGHTGLELPVKGQCISRFISILRYCFEQIVTTAFKDYDAFLAQHMEI